MLFTGRLTANAEITTVKGDKKVTNFTVALNQRFKTKAGEKHERTAFVDCAYWINPALAEFLTKGSVVEIQGWVDAQTWTDKKGKAHPRLVCNVDNVKLFSLTTKTAEPANKPETAKADANNAPDDDDLPF